LQNVREHLNRHVDGHDACVIGDTPADIRCARAINARAAAVATGVYSRSQLSPYSPDHLFDDLSHTDAVMNRLLQKL
jgi:phosphoglycolate phosphatase